MEGREVKTLIGIVIAWVVAALVFWAVFWGLAPWLCSLIPKSIGDWKGVLDVAIYIIIGLSGGIGLPLWIGVAGTGIVVSVLE
jgi:uncharacterized protein involved in cysteine biosynthesis